MAYEMRGLKTSDIYKMSRILKKMNLDLTADDSTTQTQMGVQFIKKIGENLHMAETEVNDFMGGLVGMTGADFGNLPIEETMAIMEQFKNQKGLSGFFKLAAK
jgi:hypothetical protein